MNINRILPLWLYIQLACQFLHVNSLSVKDTNAFSYEKKLQERGFQYIIGTDEVGRGAIAGPVIAASCCIFTSNAEDERLLLLPGVKDSKELTEEERDNIYAQIISKPSILKWKCAERSPKEIEDSNILKATMSCFQESIQELILGEDIPMELAYCVVDGKSTPKLVGGPTPIPVRPMVNADAKVYTVSLASIIAKVTRDNLMKEAHKVYPMYNFHKNKGYQTRDHVERIHRHGPCPLHRMSFKALKHR